jgi:hypothetical protein
MSKSENLYSAARELIPGGVNSPVRAFTGVGGTPLFIERADGATCTTSMVKPISIMSAPGARWCWAITIRPSATR